jgi:hypothetical protein
MEQARPAVAGEDNDEVKAAAVWVARMRPDRADSASAPVAGDKSRISPDSPATSRHVRTAARE